MKKLKEDLQYQNQLIQFIQDQHDNAKKKQLDSLIKQKNLTEQALHISQRETYQSKQDLANKSKEAQQSEAELAKSQKVVQETNVLLQHQQDSI